MKKLRWGILGTGYIASGFVRDLFYSKEHEVLAVGSRDLHKAQDFAKIFDIKTSYGSYEELVQNDEVDAIYVATPHVYHKDHSIMALRAGKHVLVEKPFAMNAIEAREMVAVARETGKLLMEAMWTRYLPHMAAVRTLLANGALGDLVQVTADHGQFFEANPKSRLYDPALGGGALLDLGIYPVSFISMVLGPKPKNMMIAGQKAFTGVDGQISGILEYDGNIHANFNTTLWAQTSCSASIHGTEARLEIDTMFYTPTSMRLIRRDGSVEEFPNKYEGHGLREQAIEFGRLIRAQKTDSSILSLEESVAIMDLMDLILKKGGF